MEQCTYGEMRTTAVIQKRQLDKAFGGRFKVLWLLSSLFPFHLPAHSEVIVKLNGVIDADCCMQTRAFSKP